MISEALKLRPIVKCWLHVNDFDFPEVLLCQLLSFSNPTVTPYVDITPKSSDGFFLCIFCWFIEVQSLTADFFSLLPPFSNGKGVASSAGPDEGCGEEGKTPEGKSSFRCSEKSFTDSRNAETSAGKLQRL